MLFAWIALGISFFCVGYLVGSRTTEVSMQNENRELSMRRVLRKRL